METNRKTVPGQIRRGALAGVKVADFSWAAAGPITTMYLASHGATVVRIESLSRPCITRVSGPFKDNKPGINRSGMFAFYNANKYSVSIDLSKARSREVIAKLVRWADIVAESFVPGTMERLSFGYEDLKKIKPDIIMFRSSNQGQTGPHARHPGTGLQLVGLAGFTHLTGWPDGEPQQPWGAYTDMIAPRIGAAAIVAALEYRRKTGKGVLLDQSQFEGGAFFLTPALLDYTANGRIAQRAGNACSIAAPYGVFQCKGDDRWCSISVCSDAEWQALCNVIGKPEWKTDPKYVSSAARKCSEAEINEVLESWTKGFSAEEVMSILQRNGIAAGVVCSGKDVLENDQLRETGFFWRMNHKVLGDFSHLRAGSRLSGTPAAPERPSPCLGEHTEQVCREFLGIPDDEFTELLAEGVVELSQEDCG